MGRSWQLSDKRDAWGPAAVAVGVAALFAPVPGPVLDVGLVAMWVAAATLAWHRRAPASLGGASGLPAALAAATLLRGVWAAAAVRAALSDGEPGALAGALGRGACQGGLLPGLAALAALLTLQMLWLGRGAERLAQVSARFALDALPGRQLALEAAARGAAPDPARRRTEQAELDRSAQRVGGLDGALRLLRGESAAAAALSALVFAASLGGAVSSADAALGDAATRAAESAIGLGLALAVPALLCTAAAALAALAAPGTPAERPGEGDGALSLVLAAAATLAALAGLPGHAALPGAIALAGLAAALLWRRRRARSQSTEAPALPPTALTLALGASALGRVAPDGEAALGEAIARALRQAGLPVPSPIRLANLADADGPCAYRIALGDAPTAAGELPEGRRLAAGPGAADSTVRHPLGGHTAHWSEERGESAREVAIAACVAAVRADVERLVNPDATLAWLRRSATESPALVDSVWPARADLLTLTHILCTLARDLVAPPAADGLLRALAAAAPGGAGDPGGPGGPGGPAEPATQLLRQVRRALAPQTTRRYAPTGTLRVACLGAAFEDALRRGAPPSPQAVAEAQDELDAALCAPDSTPPSAILAAPEAVAATRQLFAPRFPGVPVLSVEDLLPSVRILPVAVLAGE